MFNKWIKSNPFILAIGVVVIPSIIGLIIATYAEDIELRKALYAASITLIFGGLLGGLLKILLEDFTNNRRKREDNAMFVSNVLNDLKSVYDRVGRVRILIPAHKSAKTYGDEMRDLIEARVTLRNIIRAVDRRTEGFDECARQNVICDVDRMEKYLEKLTNEFKDKYKNLSNHQRVYEAKVEAKLKEQSESVSINSINDGSINEVWDELSKLPELMNLIDDSKSSHFKDEFEQPLDHASGILRQELTRIL